MAPAPLTVVMPVYNGASTLPQVFEGLEKQQHKLLIDQLVIINDHSTDNSKAIIESYAKQSTYRVRIIHHQTAKGLAAGYNEGISHAKSTHVLLMHQDIVLGHRDSFTPMIKPFEDERVVATYPVLLHPYKIWEGYSFWQKCLFSRLVGKKIAMLTGKFDCFSKSFLEEVDYFDNKTFRTAGEDSDLKIKIGRANRKAIDSGVEVVHLQYAEKDFGLKKFIKKEAQYAEAQGVLLRKYGIYDLKGIMLSFFRQVLLVGLLVPYARWLFAGLIVLYVASYTKLVYREEYKNPRILLVPFVNVLLLFVALFASARGFIRARQVI